jgi:hypothetical protein
MSLLDPFLFRLLRSLILVRLATRRDTNRISLTYDHVRAPSLSPEEPNSVEGTGSVRVLLLLPSLLTSCIADT